MRTDQTPLKSKAQRTSTVRLADGLIISVSEARKILGTDAKGRSDDELISEIYELTDMALTILRVTLSSSKI